MSKTGFRRLPKTSRDRNQLGDRFYRAGELKDFYVPQRSKSADPFYSVDCFFAPGMARTGHAETS
jgi:hypothetical protein